MTQPKVTIRFNNPQYNPSTKKFKIDAEYLSDTEGVRIWGQNVRFFYDGSMFELPTPSTLQFTDFAPGYGPFSPYPNYMNNATAGIAYFNMSTVSSPYINSAMAINNINATPVIVSTDSNNWTKLFTIELTSKEVLSGEIHPIFIWDQEEVYVRGGYVPGNAGNVISRVIDPSGQITTEVVETKAEHFNWGQVPGTTTYPWGNPNFNNPVVLDGQAPIIVDPNPPIVVEPLPAPPSDVEVAISLFQPVYNTQTKVSRLYDGQLKIVAQDIGLSPDHPRATLIDMVYNTLNN